MTAKGMRESLDQLGLLDGLSPDVVDRIAQDVEEVRLAPGTVIFRAGDPGDALYLVRTGLVDVVDEAGERLATLGPGEALGELSLVTGRPRTAGAVARSGVTLWRLGHTEFVAMLGSEPAFGAAVARVVSERLRTATGGLDVGRVVVVVGPDPRQVSESASAFARACTPLLGSEPAIVAVGPWTDPPPGTAVQPPSDAAGSAVRGARERSMAVVLASPRIPNELRRADHALVVGPGHVEAFDGVVHRLGGVPGVEGAAALARRICGRRIGVALGSGGARGFAHAGVLAVLTDEGIPIDVISGASAGAVAASLFCTGMDPRDVPDLARAMSETMSENLPTFGLTPKAILAGRRVMSYLRERLGEETRIEDLPKPLVLAATDLDTHEPRHLDAGLLADAVAASAAVPGVLPAVEIDGRRLVDGGVSDPVPVGALRDRGADIVVAVNVMSIGRGPMGMSSRFRIRVPEVVESLLTGLDTLVTQIASHACRHADLVIEPGADGIPSDEPTPSVRYMRAGETAMREALPRLKELLGPGV